MVQQRHCGTDMVEHRHEEQTWWNRHCDIDMRNRHEWNTDMRNRHGGT